MVEVGVGEVGGTFPKDFVTFIKSIKVVLTNLIMFIIQTHPFAECIVVLFSILIHNLLKDYLIS